MKNITVQDLEDDFCKAVIVLGEIVVDVFDFTLDELFPTAKKNLNEEDFRKFRNICATEAAIQIRESMDVYGLPIPEEIINDLKEDSARALR